MEDWQEAGFGLYLHWPFCRSKCPYCDFNSHVAAAIDQGRWQRAYLAEIERAATETPGRVLKSVFFGGGTPSLMQPDLVAAILDAVQRNWTVANDWEVTLEANPGSVEAGRFHAYREAGVNRLSMGVQALNDIDLKRLGRLHSADEARQAFNVARQSFDRVSFDLIYARQDQSVLEWSRELRDALSMAVDHLSLYQLTIESGTAFGERHAKGGLRGLPGDELSADLYEATQDICGEAGLPAYEVSNHARIGSESRHNLIYWRGGDYLGLGPGAHGRLTLDGFRFATEAARGPEDWLNRVETKGTGETPRSLIPTPEQALEYLMMSLRLGEGTDMARYARLAGKALPEAVILQMEDLGIVIRDAHRLRVTAAGMMVLNAVIRALLVD